MTVMLSGPKWVAMIRRQTIEKQQRSVLPPETSSTGCNHQMVQQGSITIISKSAELEHLTAARAKLTEDLAKRAKERNFSYVREILVPEFEILIELLVKKVVDCITSKRSQSNILSRDGSIMRLSGALKVSEEFQALQSRKWSAQELTQV